MALLSKVVKEGIIAVFLTLILFLSVLFPNVPLALEQIKRQDSGMDRLAEAGSPQLYEFVGLVQKSGKSPDRFIDGKIKYASDFDVWGNFDYWETPQEVLARGMTDCEGRAVLLKAVYNVLSKKSLAETKAEIIPQQQHVYVEVRAPGNQTVAVYKMPEKSGLEKTIDGFLQFVNEIPPVRQAFLAFGLGMIWLRYGLDMRRYFLSPRATTE